MQLLKYGQPNSLCQSLLSCCSWCFLNREIKQKGKKKGSRLAFCQLPGLLYLSVITRHLFLVGGWNVVSCKSFIFLKFYQLTFSSTLILNENHKKLSPQFTFHLQVLVIWISRQKFICRLADFSICYCIYRRILGRLLLVHLLKVIDIIENHATR